MKTLIVVQKYFKNFKVSFQASGFRLEITHINAEVDPVEQIFDALKSLTLIAKEKKKKVIFFIDEFQDIINTKMSKSIQGALRHVAQDTEWIIFIFSGSTRHMLLSLFDDKNNPLYMLCDKIILERMDTTDYIPHLQKAANNRWKKSIAEQALDRIFNYTELHPFYVNMLCNELWQNNKVPGADDVLTAWEKCREIEERRLIAEIEMLTSNQQDILKALALYPTQEPSGYNFLNQVGLPLSSVRAAIKLLLKKDIIYRIKKEDLRLENIKKGQYRVLDPLLAFALRKYS